MSSFSNIRRYVLYFPEFLLCGPSYARFFFFARSSEVLDPKFVWKTFTSSGNPLVENFMRNYPPGVVRKLWAFLYPKLQDRVAGISKHYDISNDFYQLFLDRKYMFYTCADFLTNQDTIETAQENKANYILGLIDPQPGEKILEIGCGWGSMLKKIFNFTGDRENLYGYTLSVEQTRFIDQTYGFSAQLKDFITTEYEPEAWDKIFSIGGMEHVPRADLLPLARKLASAIKPSGRLVHHFFCQMTSAPPAKLLAAGADIFPGIELATWQQHVDTFEQAGLRIVHHSVHDYRPTLKAWFDRLVENKEAALKLVGVQTYNKYLCYLAEAWRLFDDRDLLLMRFVLQRQDAPNPWASSLYAEKSRRNLQAVCK
ncbi:MAG: class I SAM-dependent methyltransferase [Leptolyngbyaceae cyanobacterium MO_188.B28]|nr:class I SAM-dependent methyltransferase [Leptolyngbyaceae cyanobacterium MO_188.B28]